MFYLLTRPVNCVHITQTLIVPLMSSHLNCLQWRFLQHSRVLSLRLKSKRWLRQQRILSHYTRVWLSALSISHLIMTRGISSVISWHRSSGHSWPRLCVAVKQGSDSFAPENCSPWSHLDIIHYNFDTSRAVQPLIILPRFMIYEKLVMFSLQSTKKRLWHLWGLIIHQRSQGSCFSQWSIINNELHLHGV